MFRKFESNYQEYYLAFCGKLEEPYDKTFKKYDSQGDQENLPPKQWQENISRWDLEMIVDNLNIIFEMKSSFQSHCIFEKRTVDP